MPDAIREECKLRLAQLTSKESVCFTDTWWNALHLALKYGRDLGYSILLIPEQGAFTPTQDMLEKLDVTAVIIPTIDGVLQQAVIKQYTKVMLFVTGMPAYAVLADVQSLASICRANNIFLINDVTGSIGTTQAVHGNLAVCSFTEPPLNAGEGAMIAGGNDFKEFFQKNYRKGSFDEDLLVFMVGKLNQTRQEYLQQALHVKKDLARFDIIHRFSEGWNVLVETNDAKEKETLIKYCSEKKYPYVLCPKKERMLREGISIELIEV